jgi:hypothetical protein
MNPNRYLAAILCLVAVCSTQTATAHPGHDSHLPPDGLIHYALSYSHSAGVVLLLVAVIATGAMLLKRYAGKEA